MFKQLHKLVTMFTSAEEDILADEALKKKRAAAAAKKEAARAGAAALEQLARKPQQHQEGVPPPQKAAEGRSALDDSEKRGQYTHHLRTSALVHHPMHPLNPASSHVSGSLTDRVKDLDAQFNALKRGEHPVGHSE